MTIPDSAQNELQGLIDDLCEGCLSDVRSERLQQMVCANVEAAQFYSNSMSLHGALLLEHADSVEPLAAAPAAASNLSLPRNSLRGFLSITHTMFDFRSRPLRSSLTIATLVTFTSLVVLATLRAPGPNNLTNVVTAMDAPAARISGMFRCRWVADSESFALGTSLAAGDRLELARGIVEITFGQGAVALLEGPSVFQVQSDRLARLYSGKLSARVVGRSAGFTVETSTITVVDLGTEFAVEVLDQGSEEVHVFDGVVEVSLSQEAERKFRLKQNQAVKISPAEGQQIAVVEGIPVGRPQFAELLIAINSSQGQRPRDSVKLITNTFSDTSSEIAFPARNDDLINIGQPTLDASGSYAVGYNSGVFARRESSIEGLNDGTLGIASTLSPANTWSNDDGDGFSRTFVLDTREHKKGYDVTEIRTIAGWANGRFEQKYAVSYSTVEEPSRFLPLATVVHTYSRTTPNNSTLVQLLSESGPIASRVKAIRFVFQTGGSTVWREVDVLGSPTTNVAP